jgi:H+/gluconate symporter-like permease
MTALPGSPSLQNIIAAKGLGTSLTAGAWIGVTAAAMMFGLGIWYLERQRKAAQLRGEEFRPGLTDVVPERSPDPSQMPHPILAMIPILLVLLFIMVPLWFIAIGYGPKDQLPAVLAFSKGQPELWICIAMVMGTLLGSALFWNHLPPIWTCVSRGAENAILPLINTGAVIGFGGVVKSTAAFKWFAGLMLQSDLPPLLSATLAINLIAGIVGSASGSLGIFMETLAKSYLDLGVDAGTLHRIVTIGSGGLDSLPHSGAVVSFLTVLGLTHREAYKDIGVVSVVIPLLVSVILLSGLALMGIR